MPANSARANREDEWRAGYALRVSSMNAGPMLAHLKTMIYKTNSYIRHISKYNRIA